MATSSGKTNVEKVVLTQCTKIGEGKITSEKQVASEKESKEAADEVQKNDDTNVGTLKDVGGTEKFETEVIGKGGLIVNEGLQDNILQEKPNNNTNITVDKTDKNNNTSDVTSPHSTEAAKVICQDSIISKNTSIQKVDETKIVQDNVPASSTCDSKKINTTPAVFNPYQKTVQQGANMHTITSAVNKQHQANWSEPGALPTNISMPTKRKTPNINVMNIGTKKDRKEKQQPQGIKLLVEGYAFHDDIIGVAHRKSNGEEAFNLTLRNMIFNKELEDVGFSVYAALRDTNKGKLDEPLKGSDGYIKYLFLSINIHHFVNTTEAHSAVVTQCEKLHSVRNFDVYTYSTL